MTFPKTDLSHSRKYNVTEKYIKKSFFFILRGEFIVFSSLSCFTDTQLSIKCLTNNFASYELSEMFLHQISRSRFQVNIVRV